MQDKRVRKIIHLLSSPYPKELKLQLLETICPEYQILMNKEFELNRITMISGRNPMGDQKCLHIFQLDYSLIILLYPYMLCLNKKR